MADLAEGAPLGGGSLGGGEPQQPSVSLIIPTFNELANVRPLLEILEAPLQAFDWEVIIVDDNSPDGTADEVRKLALTHPNLRVVQRMRDHGLSKSVIDGVQAAMNDIVIVMDGDLQHDARTIPKLVEAVASGRADIVIASRFKNADSPEGLSGQFRLQLSRAGNRLINWLMQRDLTDPLTGFFAARRDLFLKSLLNIEGSGYKILFDLLYCSPRAKVEEIGFDFAARQHGQSKLSPAIAWQFGMQIAERVSHGWLPYRFSSFLAIGAIGLVLHVLVFWGLGTLGADLVQAQIGATLCASLLNYTLHNFLTYYDVRKRGWSFLFYFMAYLAISSLGILANISVAMAAFHMVKGGTGIGVLAGYIIDIVWKYALANTFVWRQK